MREQPSSLPSLGNICDEAAEQKHQIAMRRGSFETFIIQGVRRSNDSGKVFRKTPQINFINILCNYSIEKNLCGEGDSKGGMIWL